MIKYSLNKIEKTVLWLTTITIIIIAIWFFWHGVLQLEKNYIKNYIKLILWMALFMIIITNLEFCLTNDFRKKDDSEYTTSWYKKINIENQSIFNYRIKKKEKYLVIDFFFDFFLSNNKIILALSFLICIVWTPIINAVTKIIVLIKILHINLIYIYCIISKKEITITIDNFKYNNFFLSDKEFFTLLFKILPNCKAYSILYGTISKSKIKKNEIIEAWEKIAYYRSLGVSYAILKITFLIYKTTLETIEISNLKNKKKMSWLFIFTYNFKRTIKIQTNKEICYLLSTISYCKIYTTKMNDKTNNQYLEFKKLLYSKMFEKAYTGQFTWFKTIKSFREHPALTSMYELKEPQKINLFATQSRSEFLKNTNNEKFYTKTTYRDNFVDHTQNPKYFMHLRASQQEKLSLNQNYAFYKYNDINNEIKKNFILLVESLKMKEVFEEKDNKIALAVNHEIKKTNSNEFLSKKELQSLNNLDYPTNKAIKEEFPMMDEEIIKILIELKIDLNHKEELTHKFLKEFSNTTTNDNFEKGLGYYIYTNNLNENQIEKFINENKLEEYSWKKYIT